MIDVKKAIEKYKEMLEDNPEASKNEISRWNLVIEALQEKRERDNANQDISKMNNVLEPLKVASALQSELRKLEYRKKNKPKDVSILDYTIIQSLYRQIPMKKLFDGVDTYICPHCKEEIYDEEYCVYCGQKLFIE